jgi:hypothetical protein
MFAARSLASVRRPPYGRRVASTIVLLFLVWAVTVPAVLGLARLLGRWSGPSALDEADVQAAMRPTGNVVALVPCPQNGLVARPAEPLREAS